MSKKDYPPLPDVSFHECKPFDAAHRQFFTADDMRAFIDADRAQRKPLTHLQIVDCTRDIDVKKPGYFVEIARAIEAAHGIKEQP